MTAPYVLLLDDAPDFLDLLETLTVAAGGRPLRATTLTAATDLLDSHPIAAVIAHICPPEQPGLQLAERLRAQHPAVPLLTIGDDPGAGPLLVSLQAGAYDHLVRPLNTVGATTRIRRALAWRQSEVTAPPRETTSMILDYPDPDTLPERVVEAACHRLGADYAAIVQSSGGKVRVMTACASPGTDRAVLSGAIERSLDVSFWLGGPTRERPPVGSRVLVQPLTPEGATPAALVVFRGGERPVFTAQDGDHVLVLAAQLTVALPQMVQLGALRERVRRLEQAVLQLTRGDRDVTAQLLESMVHRAHSPIELGKTQLRELERVCWATLRSAAPSSLGESATLAASFTKMDLAFSRAEALLAQLGSAVRAPAPTRIDVETLTEAALALCASSPTIEVQAEALTISVHPGTLVRALGVLLDNAQRAVAGRADPRVRLRVVAEPDGVLFEISDNGPGFPSFVLERSPEPTTSAWGGVGLGLAAVHELVTANMWALTFKNPTSGGGCVALRVGVRAETRRGGPLAHPDGHPVVDPEADTDQPVDPGVPAGPSARAPDAAPPPAVSPTAPPAPALPGPASLDPHQEWLGPAPTDDSALPMDDE